MVQAGFHDLVKGYELLSLLGRGSHGEVYRALQRSTGQTVAIKMLRIRTSAHSPPQSVQVERFRREMMACAALQHPNIVRAMDAGTANDGRLYSVFEYVPGATLRAVLAEHRALPLPRLREFMLQTLDALSSAHARGIVHRDFKPENIVMSTTGVRPNFKVLDFGVSAFLEGYGPLEPSRLTATAELLGTPAYAAPEQLRGEAPTPRSDLYAWGLVVLECLTGQQAVTGLSIAEVHYRQLLAEEISLPPGLAAHPLGELLRWVLHKETERRASDASAIYAALERIALNDLGDDFGYFSTACFPAVLTQPTPSESLPLEGERRLLSALALRFALTGPERVERAGLDATLDGLLQEQRRRCEEALRRAGGQLVSFVGSRALGIFGFPRAAEDDARRAALCAMEVHRAVALQNHALAARLPLQLEVSGGLHAGVVTLRGDELTADRIAGLVLAEAADLADRASAGEILVSAQSELPARGDLEFEPAGEVRLVTSGRREVVYRLVGARDGFVELSRPETLLGRQRELEQLEQQWRAATQGTARCVWLQGEAGIGKSALLRHFRARVAARGQPLLQAKCVREERRSALHPILALVRRELGLTELEPLAATARLKHQLESLGLSAQVKAPLLCPWLGLPLGEMRPPPFAPQRLRELSLQAFAELVLAMLGLEPAILVLEDAHWCDATTREWLQAFRVSARPWPVLLIVTTRPEFEVQAKVAAAPDLELRLSGLDAANARMLIADLVGGEALEPVLVNQMVQRADGVPLFLQELARYVRSQRIVSSAALQIPHGLRELLGARLDQLARVKGTAQAAAVIGREFELALLQRVVTRDVASLLGDVEQLLFAGLIEPQRRLGQPRYRFRHALLQASAYDALLPDSRRELHRRVVEILESAVVPGAGVDAQQLARHWAGAGNDAKALVYAKQAAMDLLMRSSHLDLIEHCRVAFGWVEHINDCRVRRIHELDLMLPYLLASMSVRGYAEATVAEVVARIEALLQDEPDYAGAFNLYFAIGMYYNAQGTDRRRALTASERLERLVEARPAYAHLNVFAWTGVANCLYMEGEFVLAQTYVERVCAAYARDVHAPLAWQLGFDAWSATVAVSIVMDWVCGDLDKSHLRSAELLAYAEQLGHPESLVQTLLSSCLVEYCCRNSERLQCMGQRLVAVAEEHRLPLYVSIARLFLAQVEKNASLGTVALGQLLRVQHRLGISCNHSVLCDIELGSGNVAAALEQAEHGIAHAESSGERFWLPRLLCQRAIANRRLGRPRALSEADLDAAIVEARGRGMLMFELEANLVYSTLASAEPSGFWEGAAQKLSRREVMAELENVRERRAMG